MDRYYFILGLKRGATAEQIKRSYRIMARICHPDVHARSSDLQQAAADLFGRLKEAHDHLLGLDRGRGRGIDEEGAAPDGGGGPGAAPGPKSRGPAFDPTRRGRHWIGEYRFRFVFGLTRFEPAPGQGPPRRVVVDAYADRLMSDPHRAGEPYYFALLEPKDLLVLKFADSLGGSYGYVLVYRAVDGGFWFITNDENRRWEPLAEGESSSESWATGSEEIFIEIARPDADEDDRGRQIDYRFRLGSARGSGPRSAGGGSIRRCPGCGAAYARRGRPCRRCGYSFD